MADTPRPTPRRLTSSPPPHPARVAPLQPLPTCLRRTTPHAPCRLPVTSHWLPLLADFPPQRTPSRAFSHRLASSAPPAASHPASTSHSRPCRAPRHVEPPQPHSIPADYSNLFNPSHADVPSPDSPRRTDYPSRRNTPRLYTARADFPNWPVSVPHEPIRTTDLFFSPRYTSARLSPTTPAQADQPLAYRPAPTTRT